ncbi:Lrp/AsnC family transcriptional regulator [Xanthovirga aplysinae]|uniref:Lrp/AsnC family transcriptional regulator n=1 Tax=Xanthovirga aplysinae TaxID=2529853 RepID=UPI0012BD0755|nr:Lrp/AsnC ligand binding domain-containing protein [Xanthovirga aplysinae]MTI31256.1 AsnC family transcriptional regulator [Xanthovirga aplysinae]
MKNQGQFDQYDLQILSELEKDAKKPFSKIATDIGVSNTMVHQRITRLKEMGVLKGTTIVIDEKKLGFDWGSFSGITLKDDSDAFEVVRALKKIPEVVECYHISGSYTLFIRLVARNNEHMRDLLYSQIQGINGILKTESIIDFGCAFRRNPPLKNL